MPRKLPNKEKLLNEYLLNKLILQGVIVTIYKFQIIDISYFKSYLKKKSFLSHIFQSGGIGLTKTKLSKSYLTFHLNISLYVVLL